MEMPKIHYFGAIMEIGKAEMCSEPMPEKLGPKDVLVKMLACHICTTDYQMWDGRRANRGYPMAAGHEWSGEVAAIGDEVSLFSVGDRVAGCRGGCGECIMCRMGRPEECLMTKWHKPAVNGFYGVRVFSNWKVFQQNELIKMNKDLSPSVTAFLEPTSAAMGCASKARPTCGDNVVVLGAGTMGLINAQVYHALGCRVIITELSDKKLARARSLGWADVIDSRTCDPVQAVKDLTDGIGADIVVPGVGLTSVYKQALDMMKAHDGKLILFPAGYPEPELQISPNDIHYKRAEIIGAIGSTVEDVVNSAKMINSKVVDPNYCLEGEIYPLREIQTAYTRAATPDMYRVTVDLQGI